MLQLRRNLNWSDMQFLVDTGVDVSVVPKPKSVNSKPTYFNLYAANGYVINIYGNKLLCLDLWLRRSLKWQFVIADVSRPIIGEDFLKYHGLLVDLQHLKLIDHLFIPCNIIMSLLIILS